MLADLWAKMDTGGFVGALGDAGETVRRFNGYLFKETSAIPLEVKEIDVLIAAASADWRQVEPAIFGTLLERALNPKERAKLGAHYTPRAYVERLVGPTIMEPLRDDWSGARTAATQAAEAGDKEGARRIVEAFHGKLAQTKVLDPACGTGNFLYVAMARMKELEGEVLGASRGTRRRPVPCRNQRPHHHARKLPRHRDQSTRGQHRPARPMDRLPAMALSRERRGSHARSAGAARRQDD
jgi:hypothetical protein